AATAATALRFAPVGLLYFLLFLAIDEIVFFALNTHEHFTLRYFHFHYLTCILLFREIAD
ncbi:MAG: hypothetical protein FWE83_11370, partial [Oscillospiraceae bacterium]|nr:hypothetical protein [Oscillospiraceae bacterium]